MRVVEADPAQAIGVVSRWRRKATCAPELDGSWQRCIADGEDNGFGTGVLPA